MNQYVGGWKIDVKNIERALGYIDKALGLDMWGDKIWFRFSAKDYVIENLQHFCVVGKPNYLGNGLFGFRYNNVGYIIFMYEISWVRKERKRESYNFNNIMAIE